MIGRPLPRSDVRHRELGEGTQVWVLLAQIALVMYVFVDFGTMRFINPKPQFGLNLMLIGGMVLLATRGTFRSVRVRASVGLFIAYWCFTFFWTPLVGSWINSTITQLTSMVVVTMVVSVLPLDKLRAIVLGTLYAMVVWTFVYTAMNPVTSTRLADPLSGYVQNIGWLGPFNHKNNLAAFMDGDIQDCIDHLIVAENAERLKESEL